jgi:hypothetical protein
MSVIQSVEVLMSWGFVQNCILKTSCLHSSLDTSDPRHEFITFSLVLLFMKLNPPVLLQIVFTISSAFYF